MLGTTPLVTAIRGWNAVISYFFNKMYKHPCVLCLNRKLVPFCFSSKSGKKTPKKSKSALLPHSVLAWTMGKTGHVGESVNSGDSERPCSPVPQSCFPMDHNSLPDLTDNPEQANKWHCMYTNTQTHTHTYTPQTCKWKVFFYSNKS